jgi:hypothetical protein
MPERLPPVHAKVCVDSAFRVEFPIRNLSLVQRTFMVAATGPDASQAKGAPSTDVVEPMGKGLVVAVIRFPATAPQGTRLELTLWVRGCRDYIVPLCLVAEGDRCGIVEKRPIVEQVDRCHTWRDHFYVSSPCVPVRGGQLTRTGAQQ